MLNTYAVKVGDKITNGQNVYTVHSITPAGSAGRAVRHGPQVNAWMRPGGHGVNIDLTNRDGWELVAE